jgi:hypothetical protein
MGEAFLSATLAATLSRPSDGYFMQAYENWVAQQWIPAVEQIHRRLTEGGEEADVGCGAGQRLIPVPMAYPNSRFYGYDVDRLSIERARRKAVAQTEVTGRLRHALRIGWKNTLAPRGARYCAVSETRDQFI